jgi:hypothetical protein
MHAPHDRLCVLTNSLPGAIRWRFRDYEQMLRKQLQLLAQPLHVVQPASDAPRGGHAGRPVSSALRAGAE